MLEVHHQAKFHCICKRGFVILVSSPSQVSFNLQTQISHTCFVPKPLSSALANAVSSPLFRLQAKFHCTLKHGFVTLVSSPSQVSLHLQARFRHNCFVPRPCFIRLANAVSSHLCPPQAMFTWNFSFLPVCCSSHQVLLALSFPLPVTFGVGTAFQRWYGSNSPFRTSFTYTVVVTSSHLDGFTIVFA